MPATARVTIPSGRAAVTALDDPDFVQRAIAAGQLSELMDAATDASLDDNPRMQQRVREEAQRQVLAMARDGDLAAGGRPNLTPLRRAGAARSPFAPGAVLDGIAPSLGALVAAHSPRVRTSEADRLVGSVRAAMGSSVPSDGGFLVPEEFRAEIIQRALDVAVVRPRATVIPMGSARLALPVIDETTRAAGNVYGGMTAYWTEEAGQLVDSAPKFGRLTLDASKLTMLATLPNELLQDGPALDAWVPRTLTETVAFAEDDAFLTGDGVAKPLGVLHASNAAAVTVAKESGQAPDTIVWPNLTKMWARMLPGSHSRAVWVANIDLFPALANIALDLGTGGISALWIGGPAGPTAADTPPMTLFGRPLIFTEKSPTLGDRADLAFIDFEHYLIGDRLNMVVSMSEHSRFATDETQMRCISRLDGRPGLLSPLTPRRGTGTLSPFVVLEERA